MNPGMNFYGEMPMGYNMVLNTDHPMIQRLLEESDDASKNETVKQAIDLALLSNGLLKGEALTQFVKRSYGLM